MLGAVSASRMDFIALFQSIVSRVGLEVRRTFLVQSPHIGADDNLPSPPTQLEAYLDLAVLAPPAASAGLLVRSSWWHCGAGLRIEGSGVVN